MSSLSVGSSTTSGLTASSGASTGTTSSKSSGPVTFTGLASGVDTASIITSIEALANQQITALQTQGDGYANLQSAFSSIQTDLETLQAASTQLSLAAGPFNSYTATPSDTSALTATAGSAAVPGTYQMTVDSLAQAEQVASQGFADPNATLQQGTMTLQVGSGQPITVTLNSQNDTLQGLATAINAANGGIQATIINDGSSTPYRLLLTSSTSGAANTINVTNNLSGSGASINPTQTTIQTAADAQITLGSSTSGGLTVTSQTNQVNGLIPGVSLNLLQANPSESVSLTVANDSTGAATAVQNFVTAYNSVVDFINQNSTYDASTQQAGLLLGNGTASSLESALSSAMSSVGSGNSSGADSLGSIGLTFDQSGELQFNQSTFTQAMSTSSGAQAVQNLFAMSGTSTNPGIQFITGLPQTQPSGSTPYEVQITSPATQGSATASIPLADSTTITSLNNTFSLSVNGVKSAPISIATGTYTPAQLAAQVQQQINTATSLNGNLVSATVNDAGELQITSQAFGSESSVSLGTGTALGSGSPLGYNGGESGVGSDVAGDFVVNGVVEAATGSGQFLTGNNGNANTAGLEVQSTLSAPGTSNLTVTQGLANQLNQVLNNFLNPTTGVLASVNSQYQTQINNINAQITSENTQVQTSTTNLQQQFAAMEVSVSSLKNVQSELAGLVTTTSSSSTS